MKRGVLTLVLSVAFLLVLAVLWGALVGTFSIVATSVSLVIAILAARAVAKSLVPGVDSHART
jgi:hypothetical protein